MRRSVAAGILAPLALLLAACGSGTTTTPTPNTVIGNAPTTSTTPTAKGNAAAGKTVFTSNCSSCHTLADANAKGTIGPNLDDLKPDAATVAHQVENGGGAMPAFKGTLSATQIADVAAYVSSVAGQ
jgi:mono/diheme cytochrome c family protein